MSCCDARAGARVSRVIRFAAVLLTAAPAFSEPGDFLLGAGLEADSEDGLGAAVIGDVAIGESTWLSGSVSQSDFELPSGDTIDNLYADIGLEHFFDPVGVRLGVAYWGNDDLLASSDLRAAVFTRGGRGYLSLSGEYREFEYPVEGGRFFASRTVDFDATGFGLSASFELVPGVRLRGSGTSYDYSIDFRLDDADRLRNLLFLSRLSVLSSLVDWRASAGIAIDAGSSSWQFDVSRWAGAIDDSDNVGATLSFLTPMTDRTDVEIALGYDDSDLYGDIFFLSAYVFYYGGGP
jgi:hypothetical protein